MASPSFDSSTTLESKESTRLARLSPPPFEEQARKRVTWDDYSIGSAKSAPLSTSSLIGSDHRSVPKTETTWPAILPKSIPFHRAWTSWRSNFGWRTGVQFGFGISVLAFTVNLILLAVAAIKKPGYKAGIGILHHGTTDDISKLTTAYHVLINILSTGLLTSSSFCMQLLCAPRREDIDAAHARRKYVDVGILSFRNLRFISRRRAVLILILALTSVPLHLLYNSAIFEVTAGQDYSINFVDSRDINLVENLKSNMIKLTNKNWQTLYNTKYVPNAADLYLVTDSISFDISIDTSNGTWKLVAPNNITDYTWQALPMPTDPQNTSIPISMNFILDDSSGHFAVAEHQPSQRVVVPLAKYSTSMPAFDIPYHRHVNVSNNTWNDMLELNPDSWMYPPFHIDYAFSEPVQNSCSVQISLAFMLVVVICNALKSIVIYQTLKEPLSSQILTLGDAVSSFLEHPDPTTVGLCTLEKGEIIKSLKISTSGPVASVKPWQYKRRFVESSTSRERLASNIFIWSAAVISLIIMIVSISLARPTLLDFGSSKNHYEPHYTSWDWRWATSSLRQLPIAQSSFSPGGILFNAWLANAPQLILSMAYFALNRMCTSICFAREWNDAAIHRKGLRTTDPTGQQRPSYFLQMPYRWAVPLTTVSGVLHWLLSQSLFIVLLEIRDKDGFIIDDESRSTVGYSNLGLLVFAVTYLAMLFVVLGLQLRRITLRIPPANHCSLVISAACHPPPGDEDAQLRPVQWGVVEGRFGAKVGHCSFTSEDVESPEEGKLYA